MTPTSPLAGVLTGLVDGAIIALLVVLGLYLTGRWRRRAPAVRPVADDLAAHRPADHAELPALERKSA